VRGPEDEAREIIDGLLVAAGWVIQNYGRHNLGAGVGVAIREFPLGKDSADYMLFVDRVAVGVVEAKPVGVTLGGVSEQTLGYLSAPLKIKAAGNPLPFGYESTGKETFFRDLRDPDSRSRRVFAFHRPETLRGWLAQGDTLRARLKTFPVLPSEGLRECQFKAINNLERSFGEARPRALIQMATGSGKTYTAVNACYRLKKFARAKRILFLVDRNNLGKQTLQEFQKYVTPDDGRKFTELYTVQRLTSGYFDPVSDVCISTIQRVYSMLSGRELPDENEEGSQYEVNGDGEPVPVEYNSKYPIETFDFIVTDECHRSIYHLWRQVLEYFDSFLIGLTATPSRQTYGFFDQNLVMEYGHERAVADGVNVGYDVYRIRTDKTESGGRIEKGFWVGRRDRLTRRVKWEQADEEFEYPPEQLDRSIVAPNQIRAVIRAFREAVLTEIFPGRVNVPKTIIFAKNDSHAEDILHIVREEFVAGNDFCKKITYRTTGEKPEDLLQQFRNSFYPRVVVSVDMIATGTDIKPVECLVFMRDVRSPIYFEQMKGRGTRTISYTDLKQASPDAEVKDRFVIVDAVGVCESDKSDSQPLERKPGVKFEALFNNISLGVRDEDSIISLANRLQRLDKRLTASERREIEVVGFSLRGLVNGLLDSVDVDKRVERAREMFGVSEPTEEQIGKAAEALAEEACEPFMDAGVREVILDVKRRSEQTIDESPDEVVKVGFDDAAREKAQALVNDFTDYLEGHKDELAALQIIYGRPYGQRKLTYAAVKELAEAISSASTEFRTDRLWQAYRRLDELRVRGAGPTKLLTDVISLVRFAVGESPVLEPYEDSVNRRFEEWLRVQEGAGRVFDPEQRRWLDMIRDHIEASASIESNDLENVPFQDMGGLWKANKVFGDGLGKLLDELNTVLNQ
jgi:type I restriction enzyme R subunit